MVQLVSDRKLSMIEEDGDLGWFNKSVRESGRYQEVCSPNKS